MEDMSGSDLATDPHAQRARKRPVECTVEFAKDAGSLDTLEGPVSYQPGDAIVTGVTRERWPIQRAKFLKTYEPVAGTRAGQPGRYCKRPVIVRARQMQTAFKVGVGKARETLEGRPGDWLLQYAPHDFGIVSGEVFSKSYDLLDGW